MDAPELTRAALYDLVWTKPAAALAKEFGVPVSVIFNACDEHSIPRPGRGHWTQVEFDSPPARPPLPPAAANMPAPVQLVVRRRRRALSAVIPPVDLGVPPAESVPAATAATPAETAPELHPVARKTRTAYRGGSKHPKYGTVNPHAGKPHFHVWVSPAAQERAFSLLNELLWLLDRRGFKFEPDPETQAYRAVWPATGTPLNIGLLEDTERYERELSSEEKKQERTWIYDRWRHRCTGRLRFQIREFFPEGAQKSWGDGKNTRLESKLADIAEGCVICAEGKHAKDLEFKERDRRWAEEARIRQENERRQREENEKRAELLKAAHQWKETQVLREFLDACAREIRRHNPGGDIGESAQSWLDWSAAVLRSTDPISNGSHDSLMKPILPSKSTGAAPFMPHT